MIFNDLRYVGRSLEGLELKEMYPKLAEGKVSKRHVC